MESRRIKRAANKPGQKRIKFGLKNSIPDEPSSCNVGDVHSSPREPVEIVLRPSMETQKSSLPSLLLMIQLSQKLFFSLQLSELQKQTQIMICYKGHNQMLVFSSSSSSRLLWTQLNVLFNCPFFHIVYLSCRYHQVLLNHYAAFSVLTSFEQKEHVTLIEDIHLLIPLLCLNNKGV